jgi:hypothetical protein
LETLKKTMRSLTQENSQCDRGLLNISYCYVNLVANYDNKFSYNLTSLICDQSSIQSVTEAII